MPTPPLASHPWRYLGLCIVLSGIASIALRQDGSWDLLNYHYYNAWAFVHARHGIDWAPAQLQSFYSPFLDLPFYAMVRAGLPPMAIAFALAVPTGIAWFFFARIAEHLFPRAARRSARRGGDRRDRADVGEPHRHHDERLVRRSLRDRCALAGRPGSAHRAHARRSRRARGTRRGFQADRRRLRVRVRRGGGDARRRLAHSRQARPGRGHCHGSRVRARRRAVDVGAVRALRQSALPVLQRRLPLAVGRPRALHGDALRTVVAARMADLSVRDAVEARGLRVGAGVPRRASRAALHAGDRSARRAACASVRDASANGGFSACSSRVVRRMGGDVPHLPLHRSAGDGRRAVHRALRHALRAGSSRGACNGSRARGRDRDRQVPDLVAAAFRPAVLRRHDGAGQAGCARAARLHGADVVRPAVVSRATRASPVS